MKKFKNNCLKYITIIFFLGFLFIVPIITLTTPDRKISEIENKILTKKPKFSINKIADGTFMRVFEKYSADQFPFREDFIKLKNLYSYSLGIREFRNIYVGSSGRLMEKFIFNKDIIDKNISQVMDISCHLMDVYNIPSTIMIVPTSIAFYESELPKTAITDSQVDALNYINNNLNVNHKYNDSIKFYTPYKILEKNKDKYIYFNTDHHWTQLGAKLAFEDMFGPISGNYKKVSDEFYGTYYSKVLLPQIKADSIYAYENYNNFKVQIDFDKTFNALYDGSKLLGKNKYQYFLHGDPAMALINGNPSSNEEILVFKDSYAHNFVPFLATKYKKLHVIDPRYYKLDIDDYLQKNKNITEVLFLNNISLFNTSVIFK